MKTILVTGADGMLGVDLVSFLENARYPTIPSTIHDMDIVNPEQVRSVLHSRKPDVVIHTAAYTAVDRAESERDVCMAVNHQGTLNIAQACAEINAELVYISTDYVFDGAKNSPYVETDAPHPLNVYGESKFLGEKAVTRLVPRHKICRTSWLHGLSGIAGTNFIEKILRAALTRNTLKVVSDQMGCPTFTFDLAPTLEQLLTLPEYGVFHLTNSGACSWFELAAAVFEILGESNITVVPVTSAEFPRSAKRPMNSVLASPRLVGLGIPPLRHWKDALREYLLQRKILKKKS
ncbi:dTDP-4-dehydrorhamnose reductase [Candidatus Sumerlaeota bacterium]|nr:dTDP-4-dehydrorhamnose reductase [Candidatus Sumerlaeota bacterium]